jgi:hypothetical protein
MYKKQQGVLPFLFKFGGLVFILLSIITFIVWFPRALFQQNVPANFDPVAVLLSEFPIKLITGLLLLSIFPEIRLTPDGLKYRTGAIYGLIKWGEIESVTQKKLGVISIAINRDGFFLFNGLLFQRIVGWYMRHEYPLLLLSSGLENRHEIVQEILARSNVKKVKYTGDLYT